ncbi:DUF2860 domain-containing protein [bacterium]|nr:DUF2860 domain-containing protein [bacterium]
MIIYRIILSIICVCLTAGLTVAQEPLPTESGFSGYIEILGAYISTNSQLNTDSDNKKTDSLDSSGERVNKFRPLPLGLLRYTFADIRTQLFLGVLPENVAQGQFLVEAGARHILSNGTGLRASVIPLTPIAQKTWEDPFVVGQDRQRTDIDSYGFKLAAEAIMGSGLTVKYGWVRQSLDDEKSGNFLLSQPGSLITPDDLDDLDRDAHFHRLTTEYSFQIGRRMRLTPILRYARGDADGDANSFHALTPQLSFLYFGNQLQASVNVSAKAEWYDSRHPVFDKTRRDFSPGLFAILAYKNPFGFENFRIDWFNAFFKSNSNIDFYESSNFITAVGLGYRF